MRIRDLIKTKQTCFVQGCLCERQDKVHVLGSNVVMLAGDLDPVVAPDVFDLSCSFSSLKTTASLPFEMSRCIASCLSCVYTVEK